jgi:hypothetical protein
MRGGGATFAWRGKLRALQLAWFLFFELMSTEQTMMKRSQKVKMPLSEGESQAQAR